MKKTLYATLIIIAIVSRASAQTHPSEILRHTINAAKNYNSLYYRVKNVNKNPFSENDTTITETVETLDFNSNGVVIAQNILRNINNHQTEQRELFLNDIQYNIDLKDSIYSIDQHPKRVYNFLTSVIENIRYAINKAPSKMALHEDTTIDHKSCYSIYVDLYDTIDNGNHNFTHEFFYINKKTLLPIYTKEIGVGEAENEGHDLGRLNFFNKIYFQGYQFNKKTSGETFHFHKAGFSIKNKKMLADGALAPDILVRDLSNKPVPKSYFHGKIVLVEFGSTTCGANPLANPVLNRLNKRYGSSDIIVAGIYYEETPVQIKNYIKANDLDFPIYLSDTKLKKRFQTLGTPNFYLIGKNGKIVKGIDGYSDQLEQQIAQEIDKLRE
ncbi:MAG: TlpA family protein disulfide reductase [Sphingobacteriales bacterium]